MRERRRIWYFLIAVFLAWALEGKPYAAPLTVTADTGPVRAAVEEGSGAPPADNEGELDSNRPVGEQYDEEGIMEDDFPLGTWEDEEKDEDAPETVPPEGSERPEGDDKKK
ncbi:MAG: hypothetical protein ACYSRP_00565 [Planctomycetota bacterium]|jgi:hypothetical protein